MVIMAFKCGLNDESSESSYFAKKANKYAKSIQFCQKLVGKTHTYTLVSIRTLLEFNYGSFFPHVV